MDRKYTKHHLYITHSVCLVFCPVADPSLWCCLCFVKQEGVLKEVRELDAGT